MNLEKETKLIINSKLALMAFNEVFSGVFSTEIMNIIFEEGFITGGFLRDLYCDFDFKDIDIFLCDKEKRKVLKEYFTNPNNFKYMSEKYNIRFNSADNLDIYLLNRNNNFVFPDKNTLNFNIILNDFFYENKEVLLVSKFNSKDIVTENLIKKYSIVYGFDFIQNMIIYDIKKKKIVLEPLENCNSYFHIFAFPLHEDRNKNIYDNFLNLIVNRKIKYNSDLNITVKACRLISKGFKISDGENKHLENIISNTIKRISSIQEDYLKLKKQEYERITKEANEKGLSGGGPLPSDLPEQLKTILSHNYFLMRKS